MTRAVFSPAYSKFEPRACERCGKSHICTLTTQCPCMDAVIPEKLLDQLSRFYEDCLCAECLKELGENLPLPASEDAGDVFQPVERQVFIDDADSCGNVSQYR